jgi:hypothetical protein
MSDRTPGSRIRHTFPQLVSLPSPCRKVQVAIPLFDALSEAAGLLQQDEQLMLLMQNYFLRFVCFGLFTRPAHLGMRLESSSLPVETMSSPLIKERFDQPLKIIVANSVLSI